MNEPLFHSIRLNCAPDHAFDVFTSRVDLWWPPTHRRFENSEMQLEPFAGGRFFERSKSGEENIFGEVLSCDPPHRIAYTWHPGKISGPTHVVVTFRQDGNQTQVDVVHSEGSAAMGDRWPERAALFNKGWPVVLDALAALIQSSPD